MQLYLLSLELQINIVPWLSDMYRSSVTSTQLIQKLNLLFELSCIMW